ncbi:hypothetical protein GCM10023148_46420 [Actinokineospora soli]
MKRRAVLFVVPLAAVALVQSPAGAEPFALGAVPSVSLTDIRTEQDKGAPGAVPQKVLDRAEVLQELVEANPDQYTGTEVTANGITVILPAGADSQARARAAASRVDVPVQYAVAPRSRAEMYSVKRTIEPELLSGRHAGLRGVGVDPTRGVAVVYTDEGATALRSGLKKRFGDAIVFRVLAGLEFAEADRTRDTAPHYAGAGIRMWNSAHTGTRGLCSVAFPINLDGRAHQLSRIVAMSFCEPRS